jgi:hypothetical protein
VEPGQTLNAGRSSPALQALKKNSEEIIMTNKQIKKFPLAALLVAALAVTQMARAQVAQTKATPTPTPTPKATPVRAPIFVPAQKPPATPTPAQRGGKPPVVPTPTPIASPRVGVIGEPPPKGGKKPIGDPDTAGENHGRSRPVNGATMSKDQFRALPNSTVILLPGGKQTTKQEMLDSLKTKFAPQKSTPPKAAAKTDARAAFMQKQTSEMKTRNGKVQTEMSRLKAKDQAFQQSPQYQAISNEAVQLQAQYQKASPAEKQKIEMRARQLQKDLEAMRTRNMQQ